MRLRYTCITCACTSTYMPIYAPQVRAWLNTFTAKQALVLTLDEFEKEPRALLRRIAGFLGLGPFPRLVLNWKWAWNTGGASTQSRKPPIVSERTLHTLRRFYAPYSAALASHTHADAYTHAYTHAHTHACMHTCIHACIHACIQTCIYTCTHACTQVQRGPRPPAAQARPTKGRRVRPPLGAQLTHPHDAYVHMYMPRMDMPRRHMLLRVGTFCACARVSASSSARQCACCCSSAFPRKPATQTKQPSFRNPATQTKQPSFSRERSAGDIRIA